MSTSPNLGKERCRGQNSRLWVDGWAILTLKLSVRVGGLFRHRSEPAGGHAAGYPQVEIGRPRGRWLGQDTGGGGPLRGGVLAVSEHQIRTVPELHDAPPRRDGDLSRDVQERAWRGARDLQRAEHTVVGHALAGDRLRHPDGRQV